MDLERLIAGRWLMILGLLLVLIAVAYFLKLVIDNKWIGPTGQVAMGSIAGAGLLVFSHGLLGRGYKYFSEGITGLGAGVLYLSLWAGSNYYHIFSLDIAFFSMIAVTAATVAMAVGRNSQRIAVLALVGGFLTPWLTSTGQDAQVILFTYMAVLNAGLIAVARAKDWRFLEIPAFFFTQIYFWGWYDRFYHVSEPLLRTSAFASLFYAQFVALPIVRVRQTAKLYREQAVLVLLNAGLFLITLRALLWPDYRWSLTIAVLVLAALHLLVAQFIPRKEGEAPELYLMFAGLALTFVTLAIPIRLEGKWITMAWAIEGAVLVWTGFRTRLWFLRGAGLLLFLMTAFRLYAFRIPYEKTLLLNARFATFGVAVVCFVLALWFARSHREWLEQGEGKAFAIVGVAANVLAVWALSLEVYDFYSPLRAGVSLGIDARLAQQLALSLLWTVYATALIVAGVRRSMPGLRYQALVLFGVTIAKVFLYDLGFLRGVYRIVSSLVLGLVLLAVAFFYQKAVAAQKSEEKG